MNNYLPADQKNMAFAGTAVTYGRGRALIVATGMATEFGKIARMLEEVDTAKTPLQKNLDRIGKSLARAAFAVVFVIVAVGLFRGQPFVEMLIFGVALAVAVVPEALPAVVTISLALGVKRMVRRNALVRRLPAVETLGSTSVICSDKTGTLTKDEMTVRNLYVAGHMIEVSGTGYEPQGNVFARTVRTSRCRSRYRGCCAPRRSLPTRAWSKEMVPVRGKSKVIRLRALWLLRLRKLVLTKSSLTHSSRAFPRFLSLPRRSE